MGGDTGPEMVIPGCALAHIRRPDTRYVMFGDEARMAPVLAQHPQLQAQTRLVHTDVAVAMGDKPSQALRQGRRRSSMWMAIEAVKKGEADVAVSAGNTGALMAMAKVCLNTMAGIERPALAALWPTMRGESIVLDLGASIGADARHLVHMAIMGSAMARIVLDIEEPTVGLLNVGVEEIKGLEEVKEAGAILKSVKLGHMNYHGFVEGDDLGKGTVDVVVTEGFTGNIALKTAEGTAKQIASYLRDAMGSTIMSRIGYVFARKAFAALREKMDPRRANGAVFLGLQGIVIKSHGGTDALGFCGAVEIGYDMARHDLQAKILETISQSEDIRFQAETAGQVGPLAG